MILNKVSMFVWNYFTNDARVMRECKTLSLNSYNVNLIALKNRRINDIKKHESFNENFQVFRVEKYSILIEIIFKYKLTMMLLSLVLNILLLVSLFYDLKLLPLVMVLIAIQLIFITFKKIRSVLINFSTIIRITMKGYSQHADIYHANDLNTLPQAIFCAKFRLKRKKLIYDSHEVQSDRTGYNKKLVKFVEGILIKFVDCMIVENETRAKYNVKLYGFKPKILHNYSELYDINSYPNSNIHTLLNISPDEKILLYQGGIQVGRGLDKLIDAMSHIKNGHLVFIGDGNKKESLKIKAEKSTEKKRIHFIDKVKLSELPSYTKEAYLGFQVLQNICFNHYSASSNKLFEYIMAGVPVVACDFPEIAKVVENNEVGVTINSHDFKEIAIAVNELLENQKLYNKYKNNTIQTRAIYNWEEEKYKLLEIYESLR